MIIICKRNFLGSAAAVAMIASTPGAAFAFDEVNWVWDKQVTEEVDIDIDINAELNPTGLTQVEKLQIQIGDVTASSVVRDIDNNQPNPEGGGVGTINETFTITGGDFTGDDGTGGYEGLPPDNLILDNITETSDGVLAGDVTGGQVDENGESFEFTLEVSGEVEVDPTGSFDAITELPTIDSAATAVGNNQSINSDVSTYLHDAQFLFDQGDVANGEAGLEDVVGGVAAVLLGGQFADNSHTALAVGASVLGITGTIDKAEIDATSEVYNILNARVDSAATAVGNNASINVNADGDPTGDSILIADLTQFSLADVSASSDVYEVSVNDYVNLGAAEVNPLVSSVATAVGNNVSINVGNVGE